MNRSALWPVVAAAVIGLVFVALGCWLRAIDAPEWLQLDTSQNPAVVRPFPVEADCYSQLARVQRILHGQGLIQNHFTMENWPEGLVPSTTAPFDYVILLLYAPLMLVTRFPLDWAGALVSPALWLGLVCFWMFFRSREFNRTGRVLLVIGSALLPAFIWATAFGRPRHQSLILFLLAIGLTAEYERWHLELTPKRAWNIFAGLVWGLACWTSLFEPAVVFVLVVLFNLVVRRKESPAFLISAGSVLLVALLLEGVHIFVPPPEYHDALLRWWGTIAETRGVDFGPFIREMTLILIALPIIAWRLLAREGDRRADLLLILLTVVLCVLTVYQRRWSYYASLGELFLIVRYIQTAPMRWTRLVVLLIFLLGLGDSVFSEVEGVLAGAPANQPSVELSIISRSIDHPGGIMAPWWLSPGLLYFSEHPIVSGSSHCGISGIVDSAKFFASTSWIEAEHILDQRKVRWVVVFDNPGVYYPLLNSSRDILGLPLFNDDSPEADATVVQLLLKDRLVPTSFRLRGVTPSFRLYEYVPDSGLN